LYAIIFLQRYEFILTFVYYFIEKSVKKIDDNLLAVTNVMFKNHSDWKYVTDDQKNKYFFIINRLLSKKYPVISQLLNDKLIDYTVGMNLIFQFMKDKPYPKWFWSKTEKNKDSSFLDEELTLIKNNFEFNDSELEFLIKFHSDDIKEEIKYLKNLYK
jgi:hypothetical protein